MNADMPKTSDAIIEIISRGLSRMYQKYKCLPLGFHVQADNAPNNMKNRNMLRWIIVIVLTGVFRWFALGYLRKAHTHEDIDSVLGQACSELKHSDLDTPEDVVSVFQRITRKKTLQVGEPDSESKQVVVDVVAYPYVLNTVAAWTEMLSKIDEVLTSVKYHNVPDAAHFFLACRRSDLAQQLRSLGGDIVTTEIEDLDEVWPKSPDDVFLILRHYLASREVDQVIVVAPASLASKFDSLQPTGDSKLHAVDDARRYLSGWARGTLALFPRPAHYPYYIIGVLG